MIWLTKIVDEVEKQFPDGEIIVSSGVSPSGKYHVGTLREVLTADAVLLELRNRGRQVRHIHVVDDHDRLRKIPAGMPESLGEYLGKPLCDVPSPEPGYSSYADYYFADFRDNVETLGIDMEVIFSSKKYEAGVFESAIEKTLENIDAVKKVLEEVSGRQLDKDWSPIQIVEEGYLKKRAFVSINKSDKTIVYQDSDGNGQAISYASGLVKLDWRLDWPARWWLYSVNVEPFGRDHASSGGSYDTGKELVKEIFGSQAPVPVPYDFINRTGDTKKMSKSAGNTVTITELLQVLPPEIVRYFVLRFGPEKMLYFDQTDGVIRMIDEYAKLLETKEDEQLIKIVAGPLKKNTISNVPFSHLVASYQSALKDADKTIEIISRTEHAEVAGAQKETIECELKYIDQWLNKWAPEDVKFELATNIDASQFNEDQKKFLNDLAVIIESAPEQAGGEWFHKAIYDLKDTCGLEPKEMFGALYKVLINKDAGPRAGWFLSILPRDWLVARLKLER